MSRASVIAWLDDASLLQIAAATGCVVLGPVALFVGIPVLITTGSPDVFIALGGGFGIAMVFAGFLQWLFAGADK